MKRPGSGTWRRGWRVAVAAGVVGLGAVSPAPARCAPLGTFAATGDATFLAARDAVRSGDRVKLSRALETLPADYPLRAWAEYWQLRQQLDDDDSRGVPGFLAANEGAYLAEKLRADWLRALGKKGQWEDFRREWPRLVEPDVELNCYAAQAAGAPQSVRPLWRDGQDLPVACETLVDQLVAAGDLTVEEVWQRVRRFLEAKKVGAARTAAQYLPVDQGFDGKGLEAIAVDPVRYLKQLPPDFAGALATPRGRRETVLFAIGRLARSDPAQAAERLTALETAFSAEDRAYAWGQIAWQAALHHLPQALDWYERAAPAAGVQALTLLNEEQLAWRARAALRARDWPALWRAVAVMPPAQAAQPVWIYWQGRALAAQATPAALAEARALFIKIAGQPSFYGILADEELGRPLSLPPQALPPLPEEQVNAEANAGLQRALALFRLDLRGEGVREWSWSLRGMNDRQLLAAADLARRNAVWDRAIASAERTRGEHDFGLRYLAPFRDVVAPEAEAQRLDPAWVYGLMRQESRFVVSANSAVGARGLMQVMPATAKWVAKKIKLVDFRPHRAAEMDINVRLGTSYLKMVLDALDDQPVLASAAYNAGPGRARRWRGEEALEGAIYAETIPFAETRDYVKKVMSNTLYYNALFGGRMLSLKTRLGLVQPAGARDAVVTDLP